MQLLIDNGDGNGSVDYSPALVMTASLTIRRARVELSTCTGLLDVAACGLIAPASRGRVQVKSDAGDVLFAGYVVDSPQPAMAVLQSDAADALIRFQAAEDAWLLHNKPAMVLQPAGSVVHAISLEENAVKLKPMQAEDLFLKASDVTMTGEHGATTYATEIFAGDGTTQTFTLMDAPFHEGGSTTLLEDSFAESQFAAQTWTLTDTGQHIGFGSGGLDVTGGNGFDGETVMAAVAPIEMGGSLTAELDQVTLQAGSDGVLLGMYANAVTIANCFAGFRVKGSAGAQTLVALVNGAEVGTPYKFQVGHLYTLRLRLHCAEMQRVLQVYEAVVNGQVKSFGGGLVDAPMQMVFEIQDLGLASNTVATALYAGAVASSPARCVFGLVNSVDLLMQAGACRLAKNGSAWVVSTLPSGAIVPRHEGLDEGADFSLSGTAVRFVLGRIPVVGETVTVTYRRGERTFARMQNAEEISAAQLQGVSGWPEWSGSVNLPLARSSADCRAAATALLAFAEGASEGIRGSCTMVNAHQVADVQAGDQVAMPGLGGAVLQAPVERVTITDGHATPEVLLYTVEFAQTGANGLSFETGRSVAEDVARPIPVSATKVLGNLPNVQVVSATETALQVDAGVMPPSGGGFEVRRRDGGFGSTLSVSDADLVLRSPVRSFSVPRVAFQERFYVRMYDGSAVPLYSERSSVVVTHLPVS